MRTMTDDLLATRFSVNMARITGLIKLIYSDTDSLRPTEPLQSEGVRADILRSVAIFLHATFEDLLRTTARQRLPEAKSDVLDKIPLVGTSQSRNPVKFFLGALNEHRGRTVDDLIQESVENYLSRESFSSAHDVGQILTHMGVDTAPFNPLMAHLDLMMKRRHRIVHEADLRNPTDRVAIAWTISDDFDLLLWLLAVAAFYTQLRVALDPMDQYARLVVVKRMKCVEIANSVRPAFVALQGDSTRPTLLNAKEASDKLREVIALLSPPSLDELLAIWKNQKSPDDDTTEDEARAELATVVAENMV